LSREVREGLIAGLVGAALVATWLIIYHVAHGRAMPGGEMRMPVGVIVRYTVFPAVIFAMFGVLVAYIIVATQRWEHPLLTALIALLCLEVVALCAFVWIAQPMGAGVWWPLSMANLLVAGPQRTYSGLTGLEARF